jgi:hypothetical protein
VYCENVCSLRSKIRMCQLEHSSNQTGSGKTRKTRSESALKGKARKHYVFPKKEEKYDIITFFANVKDSNTSF